MRIGELARRQGVRTSAIRYYESIGLLRAPARVSGRRVYGEEAVNALRLLQALKRAGFTLGQIRALPPARVTRDAHERWRSLASAKLRELDASLERLRSARDTLAQAMDCECEGRADDCELVIASAPRAQR
jgi:MerR family redox-sensitive transcriptional activator SoxR